MQLNRKLPSVTRNIQPIRQTSLINPVDSEMSLRSSGHSGNFFPNLSDFDLVLTIHALTQSIATQLQYLSTTKP
jgi:hypothetical protein